MSGDLGADDFVTPETVPAMLLRDSHLFPHSLLPLYIFEPRYRSMLKYSLERERFWIIASPQSEEDGDFFEVAGLGFIRACVQNPDGTAHLVLQGLRRIRIRGWEADHAFPMARVEPFHSVYGTSERMEALSARLLTCIAKLKASGSPLPKLFEQQLSSIESPEIVADIVSASLVSDSEMRQRLLEQPDVCRRLEQLLKWFA